MINRASIIEQVNNVSYLGYQLGSNRNYGVHYKSRSFSCLCRTIQHKSEQEAVIKFYRLLAVPSLSHGSDCWVSTIQQPHKLNILKWDFWGQWQVTENWIKTGRRFRPRTKYIHLNRENKIIPNELIRTSFKKANLLNSWKAIWLPS